MRSIHRAVRAQREAAWVGCVLRGTLVDACLVALDRSRVNPEQQAQQQQAQEKYNRLSTQLENLERESVLEAERTQRQNDIEQIRIAANNALAELIRLGSVPILAQACYAMLTNASTNSGILRVMQQTKLDLRKEQTTILGKYLEAEAERARTRTVLAQNCSAKSDTMQAYLECLATPQP